MVMRHLCGACTALFLLVLSLVPTAAGAVSSNLLLARGRTEPTLAVDPNNPRFLVASANTDYSAAVGGTYPTAFFVSHDGGAHFHFATAPLRPPYTSAADTAVWIAGSGTVFYSYLAESPAYCSSGHSAVLLTTSTNGGASLRIPTVVATSEADDKPFSAVRTVPNGRAHVFLAWTSWHNTTSDIWFARSFDGGDTFSAPVMLYTSTGFNFGATPVVGPNRRVYVFWSHAADEPLTAPSVTRILLRSSGDEGATFAIPSVAAGPFRAVPRMENPYALRNLTVPAVAVARSGAIYLAYDRTSRVLGPDRVAADVVITRSLNGGLTWSPPRPVNDSSQGDRFMPAISILKNGSIGVAFYDRRRSPDLLDTYAVRVGFRHGFHIGPNVRVNAGDAYVTDIYYIAPGSTCFTPGRFFGDYIGTAALGNRLGVVWADTQLHHHNETDVWFAAVTLPGRHS